MKTSLNYLKIFSATSSRSLGDAICRQVGVKPGKILAKQFACGEKYIQIGESVRGCNCFVVSTATQKVDEDLMELFLIIDALKRSLAKYIHVVIPHYGYARQDRISAPREAISAKLVANLIDCAGSKHIITLDLHSDQTQAFFEKPVDNLSARKLFFEYFAKKKLKDLVVVSPDAGGAKNAEKFAKLIGATLAILHKSRPAHNQAEIQHIIGDVKGKHAILFDDMVDTGGSVCAAAEALRKKGAKDVYLAATHAVLSNDAKKKLSQAKFKEIIFTDSIPQDFKGMKNVKILSIADMFAHTIRGVHEGKSVSKFWESVNH